MRGLLKTWFPPSHLQRPRTPKTPFWSKLTISTTSVALLACQLHFPESVGPAQCPPSHPSASLRSRSLCQFSPLIPLKSSGQATVAWWTGACYFYRAVHGCDPSRVY